MYDESTFTGKQQRAALGLADTVTDWDKQRAPTEISANVAVAPEVWDLMVRFAKVATGAADQLEDKK